MTVLSNEIKFYRPQTVSNTSANGGRISFSEIISGTEQNVFGHAFAAERASGSITYRKIAMRVCNDNDESLYAALMRLFGTTAADDAVSYHLGTARDTQADITGSEHRYGAATLASAVSAGGATLILNCETAALAAALFQVGDQVFVTDKTSYNATSGNQEQHTVATRSVSGSQVTITLDTTTLANSYAAWSSETRTGGHVASAPAAVTVAVALDNVSAGFIGDGALDTDAVAVDAIGSAELTITLTFTDATHFTATCDDATHNLGSGTVGSSWTPINPANSKPYLVLPSSAWSGTQQTGDTVSFQIHPPAIYVWERRDIPAACGSLAGNRCILVAQGETV